MGVKERGGEVRRVFVRMDWNGEGGREEDVFWIGLVGGDGDIENGTVSVLECSEEERI